MPVGFADLNFIVQNIVRIEMAFKEELHFIFLGISTILTSFLLDYLFNYAEIYSKINSIIALVLFGLFLIFMTKLVLFPITAYFNKLFLPKGYKSRKYLDINNDFNLPSTSIITIFIIDNVSSLYSLDYIYLVILVIPIFLIIHYLNENFEIYS